MLLTCYNFKFWCHLTKFRCVPHPVCYNVDDSWIATFLFWTGYWTVCIWWTNHCLESEPDVLRYPFVFITSNQTNTNPLTQICFLKSEATKLFLEVKIKNQIVLGTKTVSRYWLGNLRVFFWGGGLRRQAKYRLDSLNECNLLLTFEIAARHKRFDHCDVTFKQRYHSFYIKLLHWHLIGNWNSCSGPTPRT